MIFRGSQLSHLRLPRLAFRQRESLPIYADRVSVSFNTLYGRCYITPISHRSYADKPVSRPKAHTGRATTAPSKRARTATKVAAKKKSTRAKKPAAKKKAKSTPRRKTKSKAKPKRRPEIKRGKVLTKEQKEKLAAKKARQKIKDNKIKALETPKNEPESVWTAIVAEVSDEPAMAKLKFPDRVRESSARYKALTPERREHYNRIVLRNKATAEAAYRQWLKSYTPDQIRQANVARRALFQKGMRKYKQLADERQVKRPRSPLIYFQKDRQDLAPYAGIRRLPEKVSLMCKEWRELPAADKKEFYDKASQDRLRYVEEMKAVYNLNVAAKGSGIRNKYAA